MLNLRQEKNAFFEEAEHSASAETAFEVIKSSKGDIGPEATRMLANLVVYRRIWECPWYEVENLSSGGKSEHFWDLVGYSDRSSFSLVHGPPHRYYMNLYLCSAHRTTSGRRIRNVGESPVRIILQPGRPVLASHPKGPALCSVAIPSQLPQKW